MKGTLLCPGLLAVLAFGVSGLGAVEFVIPLTTAEEVPAPDLGDAAPSGEVVLEVDTTTGVMTAAGSYTGMTSNVSAAHLHGLAEEGETAGVLVGLTTSDGSEGTISGGGTLSPANVQALLDGRTYVNVHTATNGSGEIRGQVRSADVRVFAIGLDSGQETPLPNLNGANPSGSARVVLQVSTGAVEVVGEYAGMTSNVSAAHLHGLADPGRNAGVIFGFTTTGGMSGTLTGKSILSAASLAGLLAGRTYVNVHTANNSSGEIRGQVIEAVAVDPRLTIERNGDTVTLSWDDPAASLVLEESGDMQAWGETTRAVESAGTRRSVVIAEPVTGRRFFRLQ